MIKKFIIYLSLTIFLSCSSYKKSYHKNLNCFKNLVEDINITFMDSSLENFDISDYLTEDFIFHSYPAGHKKGIAVNKLDYIANLNKMKGMNIIMNIGHSIYLPGLDEKSYKLDGSVRVYYGANISVDKNHVEFSGYQTVNFKEGKISEVWEWADYGGVQNQLNKFIQ